VPALYPLASNTSTGLPDGSSTSTWRPPGPVIGLLRSWPPAATALANVASRSFVSTTMRFQPPGAGIASAGDIRLAQQHIVAAGDMAYEVGVETGTITLVGLAATIEHRVTNIYRREAGGWKVVHHHTDVSPAMLDVLARLKAAA
jgi:SnoaL-like domain